MNCQQSHQIIGAYIDDELDLVNSLDIERHIESCEGCAREIEQFRSLRSNLRAADLYYNMPSGLESRIRASLRPSATPSIPEKSLRISPRLWMPIAAMILVALAGWGIWRGVFHGPSQNAMATNILADEIVSSHLRSLMGAHLMDVPSTDQHTVKPWFAGKLDFSPEVHDLSDAGFPLVGGRLEYIDGHPAAALVYKHSQHIINVFTWPTSAGNEAPGDKTEVESSSRGYQIIHFTAGGMTYWAVTDASAATLRQFVEALREQIH